MQIELAFSPGSKGSVISFPEGFGYKNLLCSCGKSFIPV
jgi:hypothetical protein